MVGFERVKSIEDTFGVSLDNFNGQLDKAFIDRIKRVRKCWDFYEGYHWQDMPETDTPEITLNYCRVFVNKFVSFELGKAFTFATHKDLDGVIVTDDNRTLFEYLEDVWEDNNQYKFITDLGQVKSVTGEAWVQVKYESPEDVDDPFNEYPKGRIRLILLPTNVVYPEYDPHDREKLIRLTIAYSYEKTEKSPILGRTLKKTCLYKQVWDKTECVITDTGADIDEPVVIPNKYKIIPFVGIKNLCISGKTMGVSDLEDLIPLNVEYNLKMSNTSEILDYHASPITIVYGAKIGNLEKGANKMWGGLPKDAKVENLQLQGDLPASNNYASELKLAMCEIGGIPQTVLGGAQAISNTSGVALQYINAPLIERTRIKRMNTEDGLERLNKLITLVSALEGLITKPPKINNREFYHNEVSIPDTLPKDELLELQRVQQEMKIGLESRTKAAERLGKENITELFSEIEEDIQEHPEFYGISKKKDKNFNSGVNSGMTNGQTTIEQVRTEITGSNGMTNEL